MNSLVRKSFFYKQLYKLYYSIGDLVHPSRKNEIQQQGPLAQGFESNAIPQAALFFISLPQTSFFKFLNQFILSVCGLDKSILMDAKKIKSLSGYFSPNGNVLTLFQADKEFFSKKTNLNMPIPEQITQDWIYSTAYDLLSPFFESYSSEIHKRFEMRFPLGVEDQKKPQLPHMNKALTRSILEFVLDRHFHSFSDCIEMSGDESK